MKSLLVHYKNKYPDAKVTLSAGSLTVEQDGKMLVYMERNAHGQFVCKSEEYGCEEAHDLTPIAKECRHLGLCKESHKVIKDSKHDERKEACEAEPERFYDESKGYRVARSEEEAKNYVASEAPAPAKKAKKK